MGSFLPYQLLVIKFGHEVKLRKILTEGIDLFVARGTEGSQESMQGPPVIQLPICTHIAQAARRRHSPDWLKTATQYCIVFVNGASE